MHNPKLLTAAFPRYLFIEQALLALMLWVGFSVFAFVVTFAVWIWQGGIEVSGWDRFAQVVRWYPFVIGIHLGWQVLELHVAHGQTRRNFFRQMMTFVPGFAALIAILVVATFGIETLIYAAMGWPQAVQDEQLFSSGAQYHLMFVQHWLVFTLWTVGGLFISVAWYRSTALGAGAMVLAIVAAGISGISISTDWGPFGFLYANLTGLQTIPGWLGVILHLAMIAGLAGLTWRVISDVDLRSKEA